MNQLYELREWLTDRIDGSEETRGEDSLISSFIAEIDALDDQVRRLTQPKTIAEWQAAKAPLSATAATQDAQAIVAACCAIFDCRPSELLGMILGLKGTAPPVEEGAIPVPTGCGAIFKESEGWSCDCERAHPAPCKANASPTTKEQP